MGSSSIIMRLIIFTLSALLAFAVAEREFNLCAREEKVCPGGVKPKTPCADGSQPKCPSGRTDTCKPKWKRCADRSEPVRAFFSRGAIEQALGLLCEQAELHKADSARAFCIARTRHLFHVCRAAMRNRSVAFTPDSKDACCAIAKLIAVD